MDDASEQLSRCRLAVEALPLGPASALAQRIAIMTTEARSVENRTQLIAHFDDYKTRDAQSDGWSKLWEKDEAHLWDRGRPSPALQAFLDTHPYRETLFRDRGVRPLKAFVPGCGKGHDVALLARYGFEVWGLEVSQTAVEAANQNIKAQLEASNSHGTANVVLGDFFQKGYEFQFGTDFQEMRKDWAERIKSLLSPTGVLVCLEFPMWKPLKAQGPPWGLNGVHWNLLADGGDGTVDEPGELIGVGKNQGSFERVVYWKPPESFEQSRGEDMISVWKLKQ